MYNWIKQYGKPSKSKTKIGQLQSKINALEKRLNLIIAENEILKKCNCTINSPIDIKISAIQGLKNEYSIHALCRALEVRRSTYYHNERKPTKALLDIENEMLKQKILEIFEKSKKRFGSSKIKIKLFEQGHIVSRKRISKLMQELGISCTFPKMQIKYPKANTNPYLKNKLKQEFQKTAPNQCWVSDITCVKVNYVNNYICVIIDLFSRKVLSYKLSRVADADFVIDTFQDAYHIRNKPLSLMFHSDRGTTYTAYKFKKLLRDLNVSQSFSNIAYPYDNSVAESFFASLKKEQLNREIFMNFNSLKESVNEYINFYNNERPHKTLEYLTPVQVEERYQIENKSTGN